MKKSFLKVISVILCLAVFASSMALAVYAEEASADAEKQGL